MKKHNWKLTGILLALALALMLNGCGGKGTESGGGSGQSAGTEEAAAQGQEAAAGTSAGESAQDGDNAQTEDAYVFSCQGVEIPVDAEAAPIIAALGDGYTYFEAASCAFEGLDKFYTYGSFEIDTYPMGDTDYVSTVALKDDLVSTPEGVSIGDSAEKITAAYGEGVDENGTLTYARGGMKLCFVVQDGAVAAIEYRSTALDA